MRNLIFPDYTFDQKLDKFEVSDEYIFETNIYVYNKLEENKTEVFLVPIRKIYVGGDARDWNTQFTKECIFNIRFFRPEKSYTLIGTLIGTYTDEEIVNYKLY